MYWYFQSEGGKGEGGRERLYLKKTKENLKTTHHSSRGYPTNVTNDQTRRNMYRRKVERVRDKENVTREPVRI